MPERRRGAPRSEAARMRILEATARLFATRGYDHLTIEGIAGEAGVAKQTIYRWWRSKAALVSECLLEGMLIPDRLLIPDTGDLRADLVDWLDRVLGVLAAPGGEGLVRSLIAAATEDPEIGRRLRASLGGDESLEGRLASGVAAGQLRADAPLAEIGEALVGAVLLRALGGIAVEDADAERLVAVVLG